ncbi:MAG: 5'-nucleotidase C-terminal domain-containing protein [Flavobacteriaceae bacterium]|jgi:2',3'-cyclic-nucleotide 2'-phosphodiesterase (5'-nucleotidase family)|nr:5'-nucleotidase C-terminal domain-containing protein [Flavobacteriaceae bacterium]
MMKKLNLFLTALFSLLLVGCYIAPMSETHKIYANAVIDSTFVPKPEISAEINPYKKQLDSIMNQPITFAEQDFDKSGFSGSEGNLIADLSLSFAKDFARKNNLPVPDFCLMNIGGVRTIIPKGVVTTETVFEVLPFENTLYFAQLDGIQMKALFDYLVREKKGHPLSGIKVVYKDNQLYSAEIEGKPFNPDQKYWVATNDYLFNGGDRMSFFTHASNSYDTQVKLRDMIINQMSKYKILPYNTDERLIFEN